MKMEMMTNLRGNPGRMIHFSFLLETELSVGHIHPEKYYQHDAQLDFHDAKQDSYDDHDDNEVSHDDDDYRTWLSAHHQRHSRLS